jgi:5-methylcytosine-specific restriction endonuclease McrA
LNAELARAVRERANNRCEYCRLPKFSLPLRFQMDHIRAGQHEGDTVSENLALACPHCNRRKGPNAAGFDPESGALVRLFHPRTDPWSEHFQLVGARIVALTPIGRATVQVLAMNAPAPLQFRLTLLRSGVIL